MGEAFSLQMLSKRVGPAQTGNFVSCVEKFTLKIQVCILEIINSKLLFFYNDTFSLVYIYHYFLYCTVSQWDENKQQQTHKSVMANILPPIILYLLCINFMDNRHLASKVYKIAMMLDNHGPSRHRFTHKNGHYDQMNAKPPEKELFLVKMLVVMLRIQRNKFYQDYWCHYCRVGNFCVDLL